MLSFHLAGFFTQEMSRNFFGVKMFGVRSGKTFRGGGFFTGNNVWGCRGRCHGWMCLRTAVMVGPSWLTHRHTDHFQTAVLFDQLISLESNNVNRLLSLAVHFNYILMTW